jgi:hypothetical protein
MFTDMAYQDEITVSHDAEELSEKNDPFGLNKARIVAKMKQADIDNHAYEKSKTKLHGIISSMTTKELDEKLSVHRSTLEPVRPTSVASTTASATSRFSNSADTNTAFFSCPLSLWKDLVHVVTNKTAGNKRIDQDRITVEFATIRQRHSESLSDYHYRMSHIIDSYEMLGLEKPGDAIHPRLG